jgi:hypothetical protein
MTFNLDKRDKYADPYITNRNYLHNMSEIQMKLLEEMTWNEYFKYIDNGLWDFPWAWPDENHVKDSAKNFTYSLNTAIKRL